MKYDGRSGLKNWGWSARSDLNRHLLTEDRFSYQATTFAATPCRALWSGLSLHHSQILTLGAHRQVSTRSYQKLLVGFARDCHQPKLLRFPRIWCVLLPPFPIGHSSNQFEPSLLCIPFHHARTDPIRSIITALITLWKDRSNQKFNRMTKTKT